MKEIRPINKETQWEEIEKAMAITGIVHLLDRHKENLSSADINGIYNRMDMFLLEKQKENKK